MTRLKLRELLTRWVSANEIINKASLDINFNSNDEDPDLWPKIIKSLRVARTIAVGSIQRDKCTRLIKHCGIRGAGLSDYRPHGIGFYLGGVAISVEEALKTVWAYSAGLRGGNKSIKRITTGRKKRVEDIVFEIFDMRGIDIGFDEVYKYVVNAKPNSKFSAGSLAVYKSKYRKAKGLNK